MDTFAQCDPAKQVYGVYYNPQTRNFQCQAGNDDCQMKACMCDVEYANNIMFRHGLLLNSIDADLYVQFARI